MAEAIILNRDPRDQVAVRYAFEVRGRPPSRDSTLRSISDYSFGRFSKITGLREEIETVSWRDGRNPLRIRKGFGTLGGGVVTFEKGVIRDPTGLMSWFVAARDCAARLAAEALQRDDALDSAIERILRLTPGKDNFPLEPAVIPTASGLLAASSQRGRQFGPTLYQNLTILVGSHSPNIGDERRGITGISGGVARLGTSDVLRTIELKKCFPVAYQMADLDASASEIAIESLSVSFDELIPDTTTAPKRLSDSSS
jgi:hypothetical protein